MTARAIDSLKTETLPYRVPDARAAGLALRVAASGKTWDLAYRIKGASVRRLSLGRYDDVSLEAARARALTLTSAARQGVDLVAQERQARDDKAKAMTVGALVDLYLARRVTKRLRTAGEIKRTLERVLEPLAQTPAAEVRKRDLLPLFEKIAAAGHERAAGKARQLVAGMFKWAEGLDIVPADPTRGLPAYDQGSPRDRVLDEEEIRALWVWLETSTLSPAMADALRVQLLTGARIGEIAGMTAREIDRGGWLWTLPASRSKNKHARVTPLLGLARTIIAARIELSVEAASGGPLFLSDLGRPLTSASIGTALLTRRAKIPIAAFGTHDLRRTVATMMEEIGIAENVIGAIVGHGVEDDRASVAHAEAALSQVRSDRAQGARAEAWDARLRAIVSAEPVDNVIPLHHG